ncbi:Similar to secretin RcpA/CpaC, associated with Flp pilus assembly [hydrothermal vent metagenome]|uniref:Similar to secretin RcpA/CpaC, associated with Flp pilus assembly n=1 Tax=hydrothermal vent metagenome TaxID=652676 RepID=A0A3B0TGU3_9ZZZZ
MLKTILNPVRTIAVVFASMVFLGMIGGGAIAQNTSVQGEAAANEAVWVNVNMARILRIASPAATVIVGNPGIADVTIQDPQTLILTGRSYGKTNLIILDSIGNPIADIILSVVLQRAGFVTVYQGAARTTLSCAPNCQPTIMLGDDTAFTTDAISSSNLVASSAN